MMKSLLSILLALFVLSLNSVSTDAFTTAPKYAPTSFFVTATSCGPVASSTVLWGKKEARAAGNQRKNRTERVKKQKDDVIEVEATVVDSLPNAMFRCAIDGAPETQPPVLATISGRIRKNFVKILVGSS